MYRFTSIITGKMDISKEEYEQKRHIFDFCVWITQKLRALEQEPNFEKLYFERVESNWKKLLEEAIPISRLGLYLCHEWCDVFVQCFTNNPEYDALIEIQNPSTTRPQFKQTIKVEVTTTEDNESAMRRQALSRKGIVHFTGKVRREGRQIISEGEFVNIEEECVKIVELAIQRLKSKLDNKYDDTTALLVYISSHRQLLHRHRSNLVENAKQLLREKTPDLYGIFICYSSNLGVDGVSNIPHYDFSI